MSFLNRITKWWGKDEVSRADEETRMTPGERDDADEDYQGQKDDVFVRERMGMDGVDFERDSEHP